MHHTTEKLIEALDTLVLTINSATFSVDILSKVSWNIPSLRPEDIGYLVENLKKDIEEIPEDEVKKNEEYFQRTIEQIETLNGLAKSHFNQSQPQNLLQTINSLSITILVIHNDIKNSFLSWENLEDKDVLPKSLTQRLKHTKARLNELNDGLGDLDYKVESINGAYDNAEKLPLYLGELKDAKKEIDLLLKDAKSVLRCIKDEKEKLNKEFILFNLYREQEKEKVEKFTEDLNAARKQAEQCINQCDSALAIATTEGLAKGFDQREKSLSISLYVWTIGLIVSLCIGGYFGSERINYLLELLSSEASVGVGEAIIQSILMLFSVGGPFWFAWLATRQITQRFKLVEDYAYKSTVTKSYLGFSQQASNFNPEIGERLFKSTLDRLEEMPLRFIGDKDYNSPFHEMANSELIKEVIHLLPDIIKEMKDNKKTSEKNTTKSESSVTEISQGA